MEKLDFESWVLGEILYMRFVEFRVLRGFIDDNVDVVGDMRLVLGGVFGACSSGFRISVDRILGLGGLNQADPGHISGDHDVTSKFVKMEQNLEEEIEELLLETHGLLTGIGKEKLYQLCDKLGTIPETNYADKSRLATVKIIFNEIEKLTSKCAETEKVSFLRDILNQINELQSTQESDKARQETQVTELEVEVTVLREKHKRELEELNRKLNEMKMKTGDNDQNGNGDSKAELSYKGLQSILKRDFRIVGTVGAQGQKEQLSYLSLSRQVESGKERGYSEKEVVEGLIKCIAPGLPLKDYLEAMREMGLETLMKIIRAHYQEKNASELYASLANLAQSPTEEPQNFLLRALNLREKIIFASKQGGKLKYDVSQCQSMFLHAIETGLISNTLRTRMRPYLQRPEVTDAELIAQLNLAGAEESERNAKLGIGQKGKARVAQVSLESGPENKAQTPKKTKETEPALVEKLLSEVHAIKSEIASLKQDASRSRAPLPREDSRITAQGRGRPNRENRRGCKECFKKGLGDQCTHCWKCGESSHFAYNCPQRKEQGQGNCPQLLSRDSQ
eukprot:gene12536-13822_t